VQCLTGKFEGRRFTFKTQLVRKFAQVVHSKASGVVRTFKSKWCGAYIQKQVVWCVHSKASGVVRTFKSKWCGAYIQNASGVHISARTEI